MVDIAWLKQRLEDWAIGQYGTCASVHSVEPMPGHAGLSFGFTVENGADSEALVMRMPPKGVRRRGNTDVLRQVPLLQALRKAGLPVAEVRWWSDDERWFDVPFFMVGRLAGTTFSLRGSDSLFAAAPGAVDAVFEQAVDALVAIHQFDWLSNLADWEPVRPLADEIAYWQPILAKAAQPEWIAMGEETRDLLVAHLPPDPAIGLFHGDYQTSNILFRTTEGGRPELVAVVDWEISGIGGQLLDIGWLLMMNDPASWHDPDTLAGGPDLEALEARYERGIGQPVPDLAWYRAMAGYRFGVISGLNVMLHRTGKRHDPEWERIALSVPYLFGRAAELLQAGR